MAFPSFTYQYSPEYSGLFVIAFNGLFFAMDY